MKIMAIMIPYKNKPNEVVEIPVAVVIAEDEEKAKEFLIKNEKNFNTDWKMGNALWSRQLDLSVENPNILGIYFY